MKYKVGDKVKVKKWEDLELEYGVNEEGEIDFDAGFVSEMKEFCGRKLVIENLLSDSYLCLGNDWMWQDWMLEDVIEKQIDHESTIINLNDLNTAKSRQIERLMKFIAKDYTITNDLDYDLIRETLLKDIRDEDLVNAIMYHVRKGK